MALQRYRDEYSGCEPDPKGEYVKFDDVIELLDGIAKSDPDISPKLAALRAVFKIMDTDSYKSSSPSHSFNDTTK